jgi:WS/DGAT/MGAT family acyltransferase
MDRLTAVDAGFLHQEGHSTHMHIGGVAVFEGPPPSESELLAHIDTRLGLVPRYRQKIATPPAGLGRQRWIDDPRFNLEYHVRQTALPAPGDEDALRRLTGRIFSQALDRTKPLWELWLVEGLADGGFAIITKTHHALVDGIAGVDLMTMLFDLTEAPREVDRDDWVAHPEPSPAELAAAGVRSTLAELAGAPLRAAGMLARPEAALAGAGEAVEAVAEVARSALLEPAPPSPLNVPITPHRRVAFVSSRLEDFRTVKNAFGATVNDVVLAAVGGALRRLYEFRGEPVEGVTLRVAVPVSVRGRDERDTGGNRVTQVVAPLALDVADPLARLNTVREAMDGIKRSRRAMGAEAISELQDFAPPTILAQASRLNFSNRLFNLLVTNVPGPQFAIYALGRELRATYPIAFLAGERALAVAVLSYNGGMYFGLLGDYEAMPDIDVVADGLERALAELVRLAQGAGRKRRGRARKTGGSGGARSDGSRNGRSDRARPGAASGARGPRGGSQRGA